MKLLFSICILVSISLSVTAQTDTAASDSSKKLVPGPNGTSTLRLDGLDIEFDSNGNWNKIYSTYTHPVDVPDRRGIKKAQVIAEEKGKAQIVRFLKQEVSSERLVEEVDKTLQTATHTAQRRESSGEQGASSREELFKTSQRTMRESVREFTRSFAQGTLRGVTVLEVGYDSSAGEAWVKVGFSRATMAVADSVRKSIESPESPHSSESQGGKDGSGVKRQPSEVRDGRVIR